MSKAKKVIGIMKHLNKYLPIKAFEQMYKSLVRPHLDYCDVIYHSPPIINQHPLGMCLPTLMMKVESIQYQAALAVTGAWKGSSRVKLYEELGWETLSDRRMLRRVLQLHKIIDKKAPLYLQQKLPPNRRNLIDLPFIFREYICRTARYSHSFFPDAIKTWNNIVSQFENMPTLASLKTYVTSIIRPLPKSCYSLFDPTNIRYIYQLRVGLSKLRSHKKGITLLTLLLICVYANKA